MERMALSKIEFKKSNRVAVVFNIYVAVIYKKNELMGDHLMTHLGSRSESFHHHLSVA